MIGGVTLIITIQRNETVKTITITKHLEGEVRRLKMFMCYDYQNGITYEKEDIIFVIEPNLSLIGTINLHETIQYVKTIDVEIMDIDVKTSISEQEIGMQKKKKVINNIYEPEVVLEDKVYLEMYYNH